MPLSRSFTEFFESEKAGATALLACTLVALVLANSALGPDYQAFWQSPLLGLSLEHWVNDALMAIFFLLIGLELEREFYVGELSKLGHALLPIFAAMGGILVPAGIHYALNANTATQVGMGIPMATDIAFALGALALLGKRIPAALKVFLAALAVMDDLGAIVVISVFYSSHFSLPYLFGAGGVYLLLLGANRLRVLTLWPYLLGGALMWFLMLRSGVHASVAGVLLAFAIPFTGRTGKEDSPSHRTEHALQRPVAFLILPLFALANAGVAFDGPWRENLASANSLGIVAGLVLGKPLGIVLVSYLAVAAGICRLPGDLGWRHVMGVGMLGGIGFTMSIFITNLAFAGAATEINSSKMAILLASVIAGLAGLLWLLCCGRPARQASGLADEVQDLDAD